MGERCADPIDPFAHAAVGQPDGRDRREAAPQVNFHFDETGLDADEDGPRGSSEHRIVLTRRRGDRRR
jgi:hypothetical protein